MENYFKLKNIVDLNVVNKDTKIFESDFCHITDQNKMYQFELIEEEYPLYLPIVFDISFFASCINPLLIKSL